MRLMTLKEFADRVGCSLRTAELWAQDKTLPTINVSLNPKSKKPRLRVSEEDYAAFIQARRSVPVTAAPRRARKLPAVPQYI